MDMLGPILASGKSFSQNNLYGLQQVLCNYLNMLCSDTIVVVHDGDMLYLCA